MFAAMCPRARHKRKGQVARRPTTLQIAIEYFGTGQETSPRLHQIVLEEKPRLLKDETMTRHDGRLLERGCQAVVDRNRHQVEGCRRGRIALRGKVMKVPKDRTHGVQLSNMLSRRVL